jgi:hypothetical protein
LASGTPRPRPAPGNGLPGGRVSATRIRPRLPSAGSKRPDRVGKPDVPLILTSGYEFPGLTEHTRHIGIREVLTKSILMEAIACRSPDSGTVASAGAE